MSFLNMTFKFEVTTSSEYLAYAQGIACSNQPLDHVRVNQPFTSSIDASSAML